ncbi:flippase-like domain-containing protein [Candidatus Saccharibacteria bacterium]|nr:flippase-like domain-containing protein [Candidatus Saccharibacteria bacterium]
MVAEKITKFGTFLFKKKRRPILIISFIILNVIVIILTAKAEFGNSQNATKLSEVKMNWWLLIPAALCFVFAINLEIQKYVLMIKEAAKEKYDKRKARQIARRTVLLGKYYDNITPAAIGGQPFQIFYMRRNSGLKKGASTSIPIFGMIAGQIAFLVIAMFCFIFGAYAINNPVLFTTAWFGLIFFAFWPVMILGVTFVPKPTIKFIKLIVKFLAKIKIVKRREAVLEKVESEIKESAGSVKMILKTKGLFMKTVLLSLGFNLLIVCIPFFVLAAFGGSVNFWVALTTTVAVMSAVYFIPTPGNSGAAEGTFFLVFSGLSSGYVFWAMLVWRFFSYYIYIIIGPIIYFIMHLEKKHNVKN